MRMGYNHDSSAQLAEQITNEVSNCMISLSMARQADDLRPW
jgi:hypothetical protein